MNHLLSLFRRRRRGGISLIAQRAVTTSAVTVLTRPPSLIHRVSSIFLSQKRSFAFLPEMTVGRLSGDADSGCHSPLFPALVALTGIPRPEFAHFEFLRRLIVMIVTSFHFNIHLLRIARNKRLNKSHFFFDNFHMRLSPLIFLFLVLLRTIFVIFLRTGSSRWINSVLTTAATAAAGTRCTA